MFTRVLNLKKLSVSQLCAVAMLTAVTAVLSVMSGYLRIGGFGKISVSFVSVYVSAAAFGPVIGGLVGAFADIISYFVNPIGVYVWQLTLMEYVYGFVFGLFFFRNNNGAKDISYIKIVICVILQFAANMTFKTAILIHYGYVPCDYFAAFAMRMPPCLITAALQLAVISAFEKILPSFMKILRKKSS